MTARELKKQLAPFKLGYVAKATGISYGYLTMILSGKRILSPKHEKMIKLFLAVHPTMITKSSETD